MNMAWDFFKKKKEEPRLEDLVLSKLQPGFLVDYDMNTYTVKSRNHYKWEEGGITDEWELHSGADVCFLERTEEDGEVEWTLCRKYPITELEGDVAKHITQHEDPPETIEHKGKPYYFEEDDIGEYFKGGSQKGLQFVAWDYTNEEDETFLSVEQWGESRFDVTLGVPVEEYQFSNILPPAE